MKYVANPVEVEAFKIVATNGYDRETNPAGVQAVQCLWVDLENGKRLDQINSPLVEMTARMWPKVGDYLVIQADGYQYLNPKDVFERKYRPA